MKKKYWLIILTIIVLAAIFSYPYLYLQYVNYKLANIDPKYCKQNSDCILEPGSCCSEIFGNKEYVELQRAKEDIEDFLSNRYMVQCPCAAPLLAAIRYNASCENNKCVEKPYLDCANLCWEYEYMRQHSQDKSLNEMEAINETLNNTAKILNRTTDDINNTCRC